LHLFDRAQSEAVADNECNQGFLYSITKYIQLSYFAHCGHERGLITPLDSAGKCPLFCSSRNKWCRAFNCQPELTQVQKIGKKGTNFILTNLLYFRDVLT